MSQNKRNKTYTPEYMYEIGDPVTINEKVLNFDKNSDATIFDIEEINGNQYLTVAIVCLFKVPAFFVRPVPSLLRYMQKRE